MHREVRTVHRLWLPVNEPANRQEKCCHYHSDSSRLVKSKEDNNVTLTVWSVLNNRPHSDVEINYWAETSRHLILCSAIRTKRMGIHLARMFRVHEEWIWDRSPLFGMGFRPDVTRNPDASEKAQRRDAGKAGPGWALLQIRRVLSWEDLPGWLVIHGGKAPSARGPVESLPWKQTSVLADSFTEEGKDSIQSKPSSGETAQRPGSALPPPGSTPAEDIAGFVSKQSNKTSQPAPSLGVSEISLGVALTVTPLHPVLFA
ncbi:unnamed protein product [Boreogadus saida]